MSTVSIRLTKKPAAMLNGVDVSSMSVGDTIELPTSVAQMMIAEGWAEPATCPPQIILGKPLVS